MNQKIMLIGNLNRMFNAYFQNKVDINFNERKMENIPENLCIFSCDYLSFPVLFSDNSFFEKPLFKIFQDDIIPVIDISSHWKEFDKIKEDTELKIHFFDQPIQQPFICSNEEDKETGVKTRATYGLLFGQDQVAIVFDMLMYLKRDNNETNSI